MKRFFKLTFLIISILTLTTSCNYNNILNTQGVIDMVQNDMTNITSTIRNLDNLYLEDYAISEINPIMNYNSYHNMDYTTNFNDNITASVSSPAVSSYNLNYSYKPKYIDNINSLDSSHLLAYLQSIQDLFLITSDITAANQILNELSYNIINETVNVRNNAYMLNYNLDELTHEEIVTLKEYSTTINNAINSIKFTNGNISNELTSLSQLRVNFYKNTESLNAKYINILNILDTRITQLKNIEEIITRLNNQLMLMSDVNTYRNNNDYNIHKNNINNNIDNNQLDLGDTNTNNNIINDNQCHQCNICNRCGNCVYCKDCEICPICGRPSTCEGNCESIGNSNKTETGTINNEISTNQNINKTLNDTTDNYPSYQYYNGNNIETPLYNSTLNSNIDVVYNNNETTQDIVQ